VHNRGLSRGFLCFYCCHLVAFAKLMVVSYGVVGRKTLVLYNEDILFSVTGFLFFSQIKRFVVLQQFYFVSGKRANNFAFFNFLIP